MRAGFLFCGWQLILYLCGGIKKHKNMKRLLLTLISIIVFLPACKKEIKVRTSGIDTIDNLIFQDITYYVYGFSFSQAKLVSTESNPGPDIVLFLSMDEIGTPLGLALQTNSFLPSFLKIGEYDNEDEAKKAFDNLKTVPEPQKWLEWANPVVPHQVWVYRSGDEKYTKLRIVETKIEILEEVVPYGECTFQWVHQPDKSKSFP